MPGLDFACGAIGGALADTCLFPFDTIRARLMVSPTVGRGVLREGLALVRAEGAGALYKGLPPHLMLSLPGNGVFYAAYETARALLAPHVASAAAASSLAAAAGCLASLAIYTPMEVVKQRAMVTRGMSSYAVLSALLKQDGPLGLFRGIGAGALTWAPYFSVYFLAFELLTTRALGLRADDEPPFFAALGCGLAAGVGAAALTNPFDVVKTRVQVGGVGLAAGLGAGKAASGWAVARHIAATEGAAGFARGLVPRALLLAPVSSLTLAFYTTLRKAADTFVLHEPRR